MRITLAVLALLLALAGCGSGLPSNDQVFTVAPEGGAIERLTHDQFVHGGVTWTPDGGALVTTGGDANHGYVRRVDASSGETKTLARFHSAAAPSAVSSPVGDRLAGARYVEGRHGHVEIFQMRSDGSGRRIVHRFASQRVDGFGPSWSADGRWLAFAAGVPQSDARADRLFVARVGKARPREVEVGARPGERILDPLLSPDGTRVLAQVGAGSRPDFLRLVVADRLTGRWRVLARGLITADADWSPDGEAVLFAGVTEEGDRRYHLYAVPADGGELRRLSGERPAARRPRHSPDGSRLAYADERGDLRVRELASGRTTTVADLDDGEIFGIAWAPDSSRIAFTARERPRSD